MYVEFLKINLLKQKAHAIIKLTKIILRRISFKILNSGLVDKRCYLIDAN